MSTDEVYEGELIQNTQDLAIIESHSVAMLDKARQLLAQATTIPELRIAQEQLKLLTDGSRRAAVLAEGGHLAAEHVQAMRDFANDAAGDYIESQAKAGMLLREMVETGQRAAEHGHSTAQITAEQLVEMKQMDERGVNQQEIAKHFEVSQTTVSRYLKNIQAGLQPASLAEKPLTLKELGLTPTVSHRWQRVADIPSEVRSTYIRTTKKEGGEITTAGLLRFAKEPAEPKQDGRSTIELGYDHIVKSLAEVTGYDPVVMAGQAINTNRKAKYVQLMQKAGDWIEASLDALGQ